MAESLEIRIQTAVETAQAATNLKELKAAMKDLKDLGIEAGTANEDAFRQVASAIRDSKDRIDDLNDSVKSLSPEPIEGIKGSFGKLKEAMMNLDFGQMKVQFGNLTTSAIAGMRNLGASILTAATSITGGLLPATLAESAAMTTLAGAIAATGIGALVIAVVALIMNFDTLQKSGGAIGKLFTGIGDTINWLIQKMKDLSDYFGLTDFEGTERAEKAEKNAEKQKKAAEKEAAAAKKAAEEKKKAEEELERDRKKRQEEAQRKAEENKRKKAEDEKKALDDYKKKVKDDEDFQREIFQNRKKQQDLTNEYRITQDELDRMFEEKRAQYAWMTNDEIYGALQEELKNRKDAADKKASDQAKADEKEKKDKDQKAADDKKKAEDERNELLKNIDSFKTAIDGLKTNIGGVEGAIINSFSNISNAILDGYKVFSDETATMNEKIQAGFQVAGSIVGEIGNIMTEVSKRRMQEVEEDKNKEMAALEDKKNKGLITESQFEKSKKDLADKYRKIERAEKRKAFNQDKALQIVQATISTAQAVLEGFKAGMSIGGPIGPILAGVFAGLAGAFGAVQIGLIASKKFPEGGGSEGGGGGMSAPALPSGGTLGGATPAPPQPTFQGPEFFGLGQQNLMAGGMPGQQRVFVVESDISSTQGRVAKIRERSIL